MARELTDRAAAGQALAAELERRSLRDPVVLALPRGGVPVAAEIARRLRAPVDVVLVRKIGVPTQPELAAAAVVNGDRPETVFNEEVMARLGLTEADLEPLVAHEHAEIERRRGLYLEGRSQVPIAGRTAIVVDDGIATGTTVRAALKALRRQEPRSLVLAVPVAPRDTLEALRHEVEETICLYMPEPFYAIGLHYRDFHQISDAEVVRLLRAADESQARRDKR